MFTLYSSSSFGDDVRAPRRGVGRISSSGPDGGASLCSSSFIMLVLFLVGAVVPAVEDSAAVWNIEKDAQII